ncbi:uncharacterized protein LOC9651495 [Selaginella moellendorffii]|uniref:uncharacterized protein LOC9629966 n=1 Tax=Selaginella moellendorffii TaxID=88036 RepID=UPI000D1C40AD|nr:uncharacterized protein LOC9629966 [Selaginella moellendorffii]XP_024529535.1 uncharacterized protein LOC9651495 [Selaginella moellendorffii]|eukprot:XP_024519446.1 uncharacterized protein LOC9629966 [Selaginella moellendorffii]
MSDRHRPLPKSAYRTALTQQLLRKLHKAISLPSQRGDCLRQLFTDVALEVDDRAKELLYGQDAEHLFVGRKCFYEVLAEHYAQIPEDAKPLLPLFVQLWTQSFASQIFALVFYQWLFEIPTDASDGLLRYTTAFIEGASNIFWIDLLGNVTRFHSLYHYTMEAALSSDQLNKFPLQSRRELALLLARFFFFYEPADGLDDFLSRFPLVPGYNGAAADVFVIELTDQLQKVKVEPVLLHYLWSAKALKGKELRVTTSTRLKTALFSFTSPGGPMYPTRPVRHAAWDTLDCLFPVGRQPRLVISLLFRLLHPYYWPGSFWNFIVTVITYIVTLITDTICDAIEGMLAVFLRIWYRIVPGGIDNNDDHET